MTEFRNFIRRYEKDPEYVKAHTSVKYFPEVDDSPGLYPTVGTIDLDYIFMRWDALLDTDNSVMTGPVVKRISRGQRNFLFKLSYRILIQETSLRSKNWVDNGLFGFSRLADQTNYAVITLFPAIRPFFRAVRVRGSSIPNQIAVHASSENDKVACAVLAITSYLIRNALRCSDGVVTNHHIEKAVRRWNKNYSLAKLA